MTALSRQNWPVDPSGKNAFYGNPGVGGPDPTWKAQNLIPYTVPWTGHSILVHRLVRDSLDRVFTQWWNEIGHDQNVISKYGLSDVETYNYRANRNNPSSLSNHSYGIAVDLAPNLNPNGSTWHDGGNMLPRRLIELAKFEGWRWGGDFSSTKDPMHIEAVHDTHHDQPPVPAPASVAPTAPMVISDAAPAATASAGAVVVAPGVALPFGLPLDPIGQLVGGFIVAEARAKAVAIRDAANLVIAALDRLESPSIAPSAPPGLSPPTASISAQTAPAAPPFPSQPSTPAANVQRGIIATVFGGKHDIDPTTGRPNTSAYDGHEITDTEPGCSLPYHFPAPVPMVTVIGPRGTATVPLVDVGPIYPSRRGPADLYWQTNSRPRAETNHVLSQAGIDLTPKTARDVGIDGKGKVDWYFASSTAKQDTQLQTSPTGATTMPSTQTDTFLSWTAARLKEPSTYSGLAAIGALVAGHALDPGIIQNAATIGGGIAGLLAMFLSEKA